MKLFLISNTNFGYRQELNSKRWLSIMSSYFNNELIPNLKKYSSNGDIFVHFGNLFSSQNISITSMNRVIHIFEKVSKILPSYFIVNQNDIANDDVTSNSLNILRNIPNVKIISEKELINDILFMPYTDDLIRDISHQGKYLCFNFDYRNHSGKELILDNLKYFKRSLCGSYTITDADKQVIDVGSPYQMSYDEKGYGVTVFDTERDTFIFMTNQTSPKFRRITIEKDEDLKISDISNDITELTVDNTYYDKNKVLVDIFVNKHGVNKVKMRELSRVIEREKIDVVSDTFDLNELIMSRIEKDDVLVEEFKKIVEIYKKK